MSSHFSFLAKSFAVALFVIALANHGFGQKNDGESIQNEIDAINLQLEYLKIKVSDNKKKSRLLEKRIQDKKKEVKSIGSQIEQLAKNQADTLVQIGKLEAENLESKKQLKELLTRFKNRLVQLHKIRQGTLVSSVIFAKDLNSFLNRYQMVKYLLESDKSIIEELKLRDERIKTTGIKLKEKNKSLESVKDEITKKQKLLSREQASLNAMLNTVLMEKKIFLKREKDLAASLKKLEKQIEETAKLVSKPGFEAELGIAENSVAVSSPNGSSGGLSSQNVDGGASQPISDGKAQSVLSEIEAAANYTSEAAKLMNFFWPVEKNLRESVVEKGDENSNALLIKTLADSEILASAKGKVLYKGFLSGLGDVVILGHHHGFSTVYARLDRVWVGLNEVVEKGTVIGKIDGGGSNGILHFEIRFGGKKMPPLTYLPQ